MDYQEQNISFSKEKIELPQSQKYLSELRLERSFNSVSQVIQCIRKDPFKTNSIILEICDYWAQGYPIQGNQAEFRMLDSLLESNSNWVAEFIMSTWAISLFPYCLELYADAIRSSSHLNEGTSSGSKYVSKVFDLSPDYQWPECLLSAVCGYYENALLTYVTPDSREKELLSQHVQWLHRGLKSAQKLQAIKPTHEEGYYWEIKLYFAVPVYNAEPYIRKAEQQLRHFILDPLSIDRYPVMLSCPRLCKMYIEKYLKYVGQPAVLHNVASRGIESLCVIPADKREEFDGYFRPFLLPSAEKWKYNSVDYNRGLQVKERNFENPEQILVSCSEEQEYYKIKRRVNDE